MADNEPVEPITENTAVPAPRTPRVVALVGEMPFSGAAIARVLLESGFSVRALCPDDAAETALKRVDSETTIWTLTCVRGTVEAAPALTEIMTGVFGAAFLSPIALNGRLYRAPDHLNDVRRFCEAVKAANVQRALYHSSVNAQPLHQSVALSQAAVSEQLVGALECENFTLKTTVLMGPGDQFQTQVVDTAKTGSPVMGILGYGSTLIQPLHISDMAQCVARIFSDDPQPLKAWNLRGGRTGAYVAIGTHGHGAGVAGAIQSQAARAAVHLKADVSRGSKPGIQGTGGVVVRELLHRSK